MDELVTPRARPDERREARRSVRVLALEAIGPLTILAGIVWAFAQPYRVAFFYPEAKGFWDWAVQPPLLVVVVGLAFALFVTPGLVEDMERERSEGVDAPR